VPRHQIQQLSPSLVNRIAAGEVIERPASVVKELVENSIDAGATHITIEIAEGGRDLIRITDDGCGIPPEELPLAFAEHATSKLTCDDDLFRIATMGFRGEALASIGAVSHSRIVSRVRENNEAWEIENRGGSISAPQAAAGNVGATIEVRDLFFNTPARRKFLKGAATESGHISEMVMRLALPFPDVNFELISGGRSVMKLPATAPVMRLLAAWPEDFHEQRLSLEIGDAELRLAGIAGLPDLARPTTKYQYIYLNGRFIRDKFIQHALKEAYRGLTEPGRHPAAILLLTVPPQDVDVNVHPTKIEVRFRDSNRIHGMVLAGVREKLLGSDLTPPAALAGGTSPASPPEAALEARQKLAEFFKRELPQAGTASDISAPVPPITAPVIQTAAAQILHQDQPTQPHLDFPQPPATPSRVDVQEIGLPPSRPSAAEASPPGVPASITPPAPATPPRPATSPVPRLSGVRAPAIQLHNSYLVTESDEGMLIIDQHALHERILYEELRHRLSHGPLESQRMLIPEPVPATERQVAMLEQIQPLLQKLGIDVSEFAPDTVAVQAFPSFLHRLNPARFVRELLERGYQELLDLTEEELLHEILDMMACKAAVKAGDPLTSQEIDALLEQRELVERSSNCPHGRPTMLRLSLKDLEKQFKRTGF
jgi:DNA mismatch repair protein MutL